MLIERLNNASRNSVVIFINSINDYCFCDLDNIDLLSNIVPVIICRISRETVQMHNTKFYVFTKDVENKDVVKSFSYRKELSYSKVELIVEALSNDEIEYERKSCFEETMKIDLLRKAFLYSRLGLEAEIIERDNVIAELNKRISDLGNVISELDNRIREYKNWYDYLFGSEFWKPALLLIRAGRLLLKKVMSKQNKRG